MYLGADSLDIPREITISICRPFNYLWEGPKELRPTVGTILPTSKTRFKTMKRFMDHVSTQAKRTNVKISLVDYDQAWKD